MSLIYVKIPYEWEMNYTKKDREGSPLVRYQKNFWRVMSERVEIDKERLTAQISLSIDPFGDGLMEYRSFKVALKENTKILELPWGTRYSVES